MRKKPNERFENAEANSSQTATTSDAVSSDLGREKRKRVKRWAKTGCVLRVGAALVGGWAAATVGDEKSAAYRKERDEARLQALRQTRRVGAKQNVSTRRFLRKTNVT